MRVSWGRGGLSRVAKGHVMSIGDRYSRRIWIATRISSSQAVMLSSSPGGGDVSESLRETSHL